MAICLTAGEQSENHFGMQKFGNGLCDIGFTMDNLSDLSIKLKNLGYDVYLYNFNIIIEECYDVEEAGVLFIKDALTTMGINKDEMFKEQIKLDWDKKYWDIRRQKVLNKHARYNLCYGNNSQEPCYALGRGRVVKYDDLPHLKQWKDNISNLFGSKAENLEIEGNYYYDINKCGIGMHGDAERKKVIACSLGSSRPIHWQWYINSKEIGDRIKFELENGDMYIMSEKATGYDWKKRKIPTLRHAAGIKYV